MSHQQNLYEQDFFAWAQHNAALLRAGRVAEADLEHLAEEIEDMGKSSVTPYPRSCAGCSSDGPGSRR